MLFFCTDCCEGLKRALQMDLIQAVDIKEFRAVAGNSQQTLKRS
jgi:hypothetical protein